MTPTVINGDRFMTGAREADMARAATAALRGPDGVLAVERNGQSQELPPELGRILQRVLDVMADGGSLTISAIPEVLTTTSAAALLDISRPSLMGLIREGKIPAHKVGSHHRLRSEDVFAFRRARRTRERAAFDALRELDDSED